MELLTVMMIIFITIVLSLFLSVCIGFNLMLGNIIIAIVSFILLLVLNYIVIRWLGGKI